jgi:large subunit ribosomal protein L14e
LAVVVDIVNGNRVVVSGPSLGVKRQVVSVRRLSLTRFYLEGVTADTKEGELVKKIKDFDLVKRFHSSGVGKRIQKQRRRLELTDFERFKVMLLRRKLSRAIRSHVNKNRKALASSS